VRFSTRSGAKGLTIEVADNGIGIPKAEQQKVFDRLYRVPTGNVHNVKGFGLGLSYVRSVVERHGGRIRVESHTDPAQGQGSRFIIDLPFEHA
jgi:two-component system phosphate regulon sensor histidine kinase PhoR